MTMSETPAAPKEWVKKSELLAIENIKRIAAQLREERNDAVALAQVKREQADKALALLRRARPLVAETSDSSAGPATDAADLLAKIDALIAEAENDA